MLKGLSYDMMFADWSDSAGLRTLFTFLFDELNLVTFGEFVKAWFEYTVAMEIDFTIIRSLDGAVILHWNQS